MLYGLLIKKRLHFLLKLIIMKKRLPMLKNRNSTILILFIFTILLNACGGSSTPQTEETPTINPQNELPNQLPIAKAGVDQNVSLGKTVILDAINSSDADGELISYSWKLGEKEISTDSSVALENLQEGTYLYTLTVTDNNQGVATDTVEIRTYGESIVKLATNQGDIFLKMMSNIAPKAVENFMTHSKNGYYNGITFHRVIQDFMIQGGDPTGTGMGGESIWGTPFENETSPTVLFDRPFLLAMANSDSATRSNTNGSQFFITTKENSFLNGKYSIFGEVIKGEDVVTKIENVTTGRNDKPIEDQTILKSSIYFQYEKQ